MNVLDGVERNLFFGAIATGAVDLAFEGYYEYMSGIGKSPAGQFPYQVIHPALPPYDDLISLAGVPLLFYVLGKGFKKDGLLQMSKGGAIYGVSSLIGETIYRVIHVSQGA